MRIFTEKETIVNTKCEQCIIRQFNSLKTLTKDELIKITACKTSETLKKGSTLFNEGDYINGVYCVKKGICKLSKLGENGKEQILKLIVKGDIVGQRSLVSNESANLSATALNEMEVCFIPKSEIMGSLKSNHNFSMDMLQDLAHELKEADNHIVDLAQKSVVKRFADALIYIQNYFKTDDEGYLNLILTREEYANLIGTATESAIRILSQFKKEGYISTEGKQIKIEDLNGLKRIN